MTTGGLSPARADTFEPPRWVVYFSPGSARLDGASVESLRGAARAAVEDDAVLEIVGHADTAGASAYNNRLSQLRGGP